MNYTSSRSGGKADYNIASSESLRQHAWGGSSSALSLLSFRTNVQGTVGFASAPLSLQLQSSILCCGAGSGWYISLRPHAIDASFTTGWFVSLYRIATNVCSNADLLVSRWLRSCGLDCVGRCYGAVSTSWPRGIEREATAFNKPKSVK